MRNEHAEHLKRIIKQHYEVLIDWGGTKYVRLTLGCDYGKKEVHLAMQGCVQKAPMWF